jgi:hypothetical protein
MKKTGVPPILVVLVLPIRNLEFVPAVFEKECGKWAMSTGRTSSSNSAPVNQSQSGSGKSADRVIK